MSSLFVSLLSSPNHKNDPQVIAHEKTVALASEKGLLVDLTFHNVPASLLTEFAEKHTILKLNRYFGIITKWEAQSRRL
jgi:hypothetical protein